MRGRLASRAAPFRSREVFAPVASYSSGGGKGNKDDKSWGEIADEAASLAKNVAGKVTQSVTGLLGGLLPSTKGSTQEVKVVDPKKEAGEALYQRGNELGRELFGGGLMGRAMGGLVGRALRSVGEGLAEASRQAEEVQAQAAAAIESDSRVRSALGGSCQVGSPMSQSSMTQVINGRSSRRVSLVMPVQGANGRMAQAQVEFTDSSETTAQDLTATVRLPDGTTVRIKGGGSGGGSSSYAAGQTIDVEWREL